jgi:hypothetical protein
MYYFYSSERVLTIYVLPIGWLPVISLLSCLSDFPGPHHLCRKLKSNVYFNKDCGCQGRSHNVCTWFNETEDVSPLLIALSTEVWADTRKEFSCVGANHSAFRITSVLTGLEIGFLWLNFFRQSRRKSRRIPRFQRSFFVPENSTCFIDKYIESISFNWNYRQNEFESFRANIILVRIDQHDTYCIRNLTLLIFLDILQHPQ